MTNNTTPAPTLHQALSNLLYAVVIDRPVVAQMRAAGVPLDPRLLSEDDPVIKDARAALTANPEPPLDVAPAVARKLVRDEPEEPPEPKPAAKGRGAYEHKKKCDRWEAGIKCCRDEGHEGAHKFPKPRKAREVGVGPGGYHHHPKCAFRDPLTGARCRRDRDHEGEHATSRAWLLPEQAANNHKDQ